MNTRNLAQTLALSAAALLAQLQLPAQPWQTVDDFQYTPGKASGPSGMGADTLGNIYSVGSGRDAANISHALVMRSSDQGATWETIEDYNYLPGASTSFVRFGVDPAQNLYVVGGANFYPGDSRWLVRQSADLGATWQTVDDFTYASGWASAPQGIAADNSGNIYVAGTVSYLHSPQPAIDRWLVRRSRDAGATWATVDIYQYNGYLTPAVGVVSTPAGVFVAGYGGLHWIVRKSTDGGQTWSIANDFLYPNASGSGMSGFTADNKSNLYACGQVSVTTVTRKSSTTQYYMVVRKGINGGTSWQTVDTFPNPGTPFFRLGSDALGNIYAVGKGANGHWLIRKGSNNGTSWSTVDDFQYGTVATAAACGMDVSGNAYVAGSGTDPVTGGHWLVRKATP